MLSPSLTRPPLPTQNGVSASCVALPAGVWRTLAEYLASRFVRIPLEEWQARMGRGDVLDASGNPLSPDCPYQPHRKIYYYRSLPPEIPIPFQETVIYQDAWIVVADKPHFLPVVPSGRYLQETLLVRLKRKLAIDTLSPMHRIDQDTAGLVLFTIQPKTRNAYQAMFRQRAVEKHYEAIAPYRSGITLPAIVRNRLAEAATFMQMHITEGEPNAETRVALRETQGTLARYALQPITGQRHQLRVHMASLDLPIVNDRIYPVLYPELPLGEAPDFDQPLKLLAKSIAFTDPVTGEHRTFESQRCLQF
ncbi:MAG: pseudouridine synthase [Oxalobacter sp.]|nr:MAG: pseudouridine synthase [Oxalobacter sp.]